MTKRAPKLDTRTPEDVSDGYLKLLQGAFPTTKFEVQACEAGTLPRARSRKKPSRSTPVLVGPDDIELAANCITRPLDGGVSVNSAGSCYCNIPEFYVHCNGPDKSENEVSVNNRSIGAIGGLIAIARLHHKDDFSICLTHRGPMIHSGRPEGFFSAMIISAIAI